MLILKNPPYYNVYKEFGRMFKLGDYFYILKKIRNSNLSHLECGIKIIEEKELSYYLKTMIFGKFLEMKYRNIIIKLLLSEFKKFI
ncbi:MAG: hypothetical protein ACOC2W_03790 [bacterium]